MDIIYISFLEAEVPRINPSSLCNFSLNRPLQLVGGGLLIRIQHYIYTQSCKHHHFRILNRMFATLCIYIYITHLMKNQSCSKKTNAEFQIFTGFPWNHHSQFRRATADPPTCWPQRAPPRPPRQASVTMRVLEWHPKWMVYSGKSHVTDVFILVYSGKSHVTDVFILVYSGKSHVPDVFILVYSGKSHVTDVFILVYSGKSHLIDENPI